MRLDNAPLDSRLCGHSAALDAHQTTALKALLLIVGMSGPIIGLAVFLREGWSVLTFLALLTGMVAGVLWIFLRRGHVQVVTSGLVLVFLIAGTLGTVHNGSVRSAASYVLLASMVVAGSFLPRAAALGVGVYIVGTLGLLNGLEQHGLLKGSLPAVGWTVWVTQSTVMMAILISSLFGRYRLTQVVREQEAALEAAQGAQASLRASQQRFRTMFQSNPVACLVQSYLSMKVLDANDSFCELFQYPFETLVSGPLPAFWADNQAEMAFRAALREQGRVKGVRARGVRQDGSQIDCLVYGEVIRQIEEPLVLIMVLDVSKETASRLEMEKAQERFKKAFEFSPLGMTISRLSDGRVVAANPANKQVLGWSENDLVGKSEDEVGFWLSQADRERFATGLRDDGRLLGHETRMQTQQGAIADVRIWAERIEVDGEACALAFTMNVTEEKRREAMLMNIAEGVSSKTGEAFFHSWAEHLGVAVGASTVLVAETAPDTQLNTLALLAGGCLQSTATINIPPKLLARLLLQDGILFIENPTAQDQTLIPSLQGLGQHDIHAMAGAILKDADGSAIGLIFVAWSAAPWHFSADLRALLSIFSSRCNAELVRLQRDRKISALYDTLEQRVHARTAQLQYLNRELDSFAYSVSHDLKSPLRAIEGFLHMLHEQMADRLTPSDEDLIQRIVASTARMGGLIADLLSLARVSQGQLQRMVVNLNDLAESVIRLQQDRDPTHHVDIVVAPGLLADCDPRMAQIVLENLIGNAWKYAHKKDRPRIELGQRPAEPGAPAVFFVKDNGAGFDMAQTHRLFLPFTRLHTASEFEGSGIGLATVRRILERHGGFVRAEGQVGVGATFEFCFGVSSAD